MIMILLLAYWRSCYEDGQSAGEMMEHRLGKRRFISMPVELRFEFGRTAPGVVRNISRGGMYVETLAKPGTYTCLEVGMEPPSASGLALLWLPMFVVHCSAAGIGLMMYKDVNSAADAAVERLLHGKRFRASRRRCGVTGTG